MSWPRIPLWKSPRNASLLLFAPNVLVARFTSPPSPPHPHPRFLHTGEKHKQLHSLGKLAAFHSSCFLEGIAIPVPGPSTLLEEWHVECDYKYVGHLVDIMLVDVSLWKLDNYTKWVTLCMWHCMCMCACTEATKCVLVSILDLPIQWVTQ